MFYASGFLRARPRHLRHRALPRPGQGELRTGRGAAEKWFLRHLQIIGEASRGLPEDVRALAPEIPWSNIIGMRNILAHGYFDIDTDIVWEAATRGVPNLKPAVERLLRTLNERDR
jgi:uncharacterized protein with HEPN domain